MTRLSDRLDSIRVILTNHPNGYLLVTIDNIERSVSGVYKIQTVLDDSNQIITLGKNPVAYSSIEYKLLSVSDFNSLQPGNNILIPITLLDVSEERLLYRIVNTRFVYKLSRSSWNNIILHFM